MRNPDLSRCTILMNRRVSDRVICSSQLDTTWADKGASSSLAGLPIIMRHSNCSIKNSGMVDNMYSSRNDVPIRNNSPSRGSGTPAAFRRSSITSRVSLKALPGRYVSIREMRFSCKNHIKTNTSGISQQLLQPKEKILTSLMG